MVLGMDWQVMTTWSMDWTENFEVDMVVSRIKEGKVEGRRYEYGWFGGLVLVVDVLKGNC